MPSLESLKAIPRKLVRGHRSQSSIHAVPRKKLSIDITNQIKKTTTIISTDATNYYDHIVHPISSMSCQYFGLELDHIIILFSAI